MLLCVLMLFSALSVSASAAVKPSNPTSLTAVNVKANAATLSWSSCSNATGYRIFQKVNGKWNVYKELTGTSFTVTGLHALNTYEFGIRSLRKEAGKTVVSSGYRTIRFKTGGLVAPVLTGTAGVNSIKLSWSVVPGTRGYAVYQYTGGKWKLIGTPSAGRKDGTVKNLTHNTTYRFAMRAFTVVDGKNVLGPVSNYYTVKTLDRNKVSLTCSAVSASAARLNWTKALDASGYRIYYYNNGTWKTVKTFMSRDTLTGVVYGLTGDTKYQFRVRAFKKSGSSVKWYEWSNTCTVISNPSEKELTVYRTEELRSLLEADSFTFSYKTRNSTYGTVPVTISKSGDSYHLSTKVNEFGYSLLNNEDGCYIILDERMTYIKVPELLSGPFNIGNTVEELLPDESWSSTATVEAFDGKTAICETFVNSTRTVTLKYYYKNGEFLGINEYGFGGILNESATVVSLKDGATESLFVLPDGYSNILYPGTEEPDIGDVFEEIL